MKDDFHQLKKESSTIEKQNDNLEIQIESQQQYPRRNCLLIHGLPPHSPQPNENTDQAVIEFFNTHLEIAVMKKIWTDPTGFIIQIVQSLLNLFITI